MYSTPPLRIFYWRGLDNGGKNAIIGDTPLAFQCLPGIPSKHGGGDSMLITCNDCHISFSAGHKNSLQCPSCQKWYYRCASCKSYHPYQVLVPGYVR